MNFLYQIGKSSLLHFPYPLEFFLFFYNFCLKLPTDNCFSLFKKTFCRRVFQKSWNVLDFLQHFGPTEVCHPRGGAQYVRVGGRRTGLHRLLRLQAPLLRTSWRSLQRHHPDSTGLPHHLHSARLRNLPTPRRQRSRSRPQMRRHGIVFLANILLDYYSLFDWLINWLIELTFWFENWIIDCSLFWSIDWLIGWFIVWFIDWFDLCSIDWWIDWLCHWLIVAW